MLEYLDAALTALQMRNWYALAAALMFLAIWAWKRWGEEKILPRIPDGYRYVPGVVIGAFTAFTAAAASGASVRNACLAAVGGLLGITLPAMGAHSLLKESTLSYGGGPGGKPRAPKPTTWRGAATLAFGTILAFATSLGCASWKPVAHDANTIARELCGQHYSARQKLSFEDAAKAFCDTQKELDPWLDAVLSAKRQGASRVELEAGAQP